MNKFFSIIIPLYNTNPERFKRICDYISSQPCVDDIELILIDDASPDKSYNDIINDVTFDFTLRVLTENVGQGVARQIGADIAKGEWLTFVDHDDDLVGDISVVKEDIIKNKCEFLYETTIIIANDYDFHETGLYRLSNKPNYLHGKFINREELMKSNIKFHPELKTHEDTYYFGTLNAYTIMLQKDNPDRCIRYINDEFISYIWYLWPDSTSHKVGIWLETHFSDYTRAIKESIIFTDACFKDEVMTATRATSAVLSLYFHLQYLIYKYRLEVSCPVDWMAEWKDIVDFAFLMCGLSKAELIEFAYENPTTYNSFKSDVIEGDGDFVEFYSFRDFINMIK